MLMGCHEHFEDSSPLLTQQTQQWLAAGEEKGVMDHHDKDCVNLLVLVFV